MEIGVQLQISAPLLQGRNFHYLVNRRLDGLQNRPGPLGEREKVFLVQTVTWSLKREFNL
jgi:hypothetical protein